METVLLLIITVTFIIVASAHWKLHPFLSLLLAALAMGLLTGMDARMVMQKITEGFGNTLKSIGIVIAFGTIIGIILEKSNGARTMADTILKLVGEKRSPLAMSLTGFLVSIPVFCDSGFVILSTLNRALSRKTGVSLAVFAIALATGLYATHVFVPPTPGPLAAAATLQADIGMIILLGLVVAIPTAGVGWLWAVFYARRFQIVPDTSTEQVPLNTSQPSVPLAFAPILVPIVLIALKSIADYPTTPFGEGMMAKLFGFIGHPVNALLIGVFLAFLLKARRNKQLLFDWVSMGLKSAGAIILITGAGGAFGNVLRATDIGDTIGQVLTRWPIGIFMPFLIAAIIKTAQGSSTVAIITTAALISPLLGTLGLESELGKALAVLAIGAGAMTVSHVNDSYFWVVAQFSDMDTATALRSFTLATFLQGTVGIVVVAILTAILI